MDALALIFIVLPFAVLGGLFFIALINYELAPRVASLPHHQRAALIVLAGWSLIVAADVGSTHYGIPGAVGAFCLTFFGVPLLFVATGYAVAFLMEQRTTIREILSADDGIGMFLAWISLPACAFLFFGDGDPGTLSVAFWYAGVGCYFGILWFIGAVYGALKMLDCVEDTGHGLKVPGWFPVWRSDWLRAEADKVQARKLAGDRLREIGSLRDQLASVRCQRDEAEAQSVENYTRAMVLQRGLVNQESLKSQIRDLQRERHRAWEAKDAHEKDAEAWRAEADGLREEIDDLKFGADLDAASLARLTGELQDAETLLAAALAAGASVMAQASREITVLQERLDVTHDRIQLLTPLANQHGTTADLRAHFEALTLSEIDTPPEAAN